MEIGQTCTRRLPLEALKARVSIAANHMRCTSMCFFENFHAKVQRLVLVRLPVEDRMGEDVGKLGLLRKNVWHTRRSLQLETRLARASQE